MKRATLFALVLAGCAVDAPLVGPVVTLAVPPGEPMLDAYVDGALAWRELEFDVQTEPSTLPQCAYAWYTVDDTHRARTGFACQINIGFVRDPRLREDTGSNARADRVNRVVLIDADVTDYYELLRASAHEVGHIVLDTSQHTIGGVMGGSGWNLEPVDFALACETIHRCR